MPHCGEGVEVDDASFGFFECSFCEEEFEWSGEKNHVYEAFTDPFGFAIGAIGPFTTVVKRRTH